MADFNYTLIKPLTPLASPSGSVFVNNATTASYLRTILLHNVSSSLETVQLWYMPSGSALTPMSLANRFLNVGISGSSTYLLEFGAPGLIMTQSGATIYGGTTDANGVNISIFGGQEL
jgi:hypothetical protein